MSLAWTGSMEIPMARNRNPSLTLDEMNGGVGTRGGIDPNRLESRMGGHPSLSKGATSFPKLRGLNDVVKTIVGGPRQPFVVWSQRSVFWWHAVRGRGRDRDRDRDATPRGVFM